MNQISKLVQRNCPHCHLENALQSFYRQCNDVDMSGLGLDELDPQESQEKKKRNSSKKVPAQEEKCKTQTQGKTKSKVQTNKKHSTVQTNKKHRHCTHGCGRRKQPMLKMLHRQVKKRRAKAKTNAQTRKQGHYIDSR